MQIVYRDLTYTVSVDEKGKGTVKKDILKGLSGVIQPGRLTFVMWVGEQPHAMVCNCAVHVVAMQVMNIAPSDPHT